MATFTTYIAWSLMDHGLSYWPAFVLTLLIAFAGGVGIERVLIRPVEHRPEIVIVIMTIGLLIVDQRSHRLDLGSGGQSSFDSPFPNKIGRSSAASRSRPRTSGRSASASCRCSSSGRFFRFTTLGLAMRAVAVQPGASRLMGVRVGWMLALGWGFAAVLGAIAGLMAAPTVFLDPNMMLVILIYAFAAAVLGGIDSPIGAVVGGLILGVTVNLLGRYVDLVGQELRAADGARRPAARPRRPAAGAVRTRDREARVTRGRSSTCCSRAVVAADLIACSRSAPASSGSASSRTSRSTSSRCSA